MTVRMAKYVSGWQKFRSFSSFKKFYFCKMDLPLDLKRVIHKNFRVDNHTRHVYIYDLTK